MRVARTRTPARDRAPLRSRPTSSKRAVRRLSRGRMEVRRRALVLLVTAGLIACMSSRAVAGPAFGVVVLGDAGGLAEDDLTSFLVFPTGGDAGIALDAGTLHAGIRAALAKGAFAKL